MSEEITVKVNSYGPGRPLGLVYFDPVSGKKKAKSAGTADWREAERLAGELEKELRSGRYAPASKITWKEFRERFEREHVAALAESSHASYQAALNHVERVLNPDRLAKLTTAVMSDFRNKLRSGDEAKARKPMKETTIDTTCRHVKAALRWAESMGLMVKAPKVQAASPKAARARAVTTEEYERMLEAVPKVRPRDADAWTCLVTGLWLSGLRIGEAVRLSWDPDAGFMVDLGGRRPRFRIYSEAQKARRDETLPMTPDFAEWLLSTFPEGEREGLVFKMGVKRNEAGSIVSAIGKKAGVVTNKATNKRGSAHDLRRAFGTRWARKVMPATLQRLMRHADIGTTMKYYVGIDADDMADELWEKFGNTSGNNAPSSPRNEEGESPAATDETPSHDRG